ncbi:MAG: PAS domain S-box protein [Thermodesulfobacteriota bacterium]
METYPEPPKPTEIDLTQLQARIGVLEQAEARLKRELEVSQKEAAQYWAFIEKATDIIYRTDANGYLTYANPASERITGYTKEELVSHHYLELIRPDFRDEAARTYGKQFIYKISDTYFEFPLVAKDGCEIWLGQHVQLLTNEDQVIGFQAIARDKTARKQAEEALKSSLSLLSASLESTADGLLIVDREGKIVRWNQKFAEMWKIPEEVLSSRDDEKAINHVLSQLADPEQFLVKVSALYAQPEESSFDQIKFVDGRVFERYSQPQRIEDNIVGRVWSFRDITERKQAEEEKRKLEEQLQRAEKMEALGTLAGGVAHDLNNVLGVIVGYSELLLYDIDASSKFRPRLENILDGSQRAAAIVQDLLTLARRGISSRQVLNLNKIIVNCQNSPEFEKLFSYHPSVKLKTDLERDLLNIPGSSVHLGKALFNLISNASEAMPNGGTLTIKTSNLYLDKPINGYDAVREGDYAVISVADTGEGIPVANLKRIFEPFYTKKVMGRSGTGLGLAVVWGTVKDHHGYINVLSQEGKGSTFTLYFPGTREEITTEDVTVSISKYMGKGETILIVDDVKGQRDLAEEMLKKLNYNVTSVSSGEEAVAYLKENMVDLMVLDMIMDPGMDGLDTYRTVLEIRPKQKALIVSGFSATERVNAAQTIGAGAFVKKPYVIEKLGLAVRKELARIT